MDPQRIVDLINHAQTDLDQAVILIRGTMSNPVSPVLTMDPRSANASHHGTDAAGKVEAVHVTVHQTPGAVYRCTHVSVIGEVEAQGKPIAYVSVFNRSGQYVEDARIVLATGYQGGLTFDEVIAVQNDHQPREVVISSVFEPPNLGGLAIYVADPGDNWRIISDVVASLGLPGNRHVGYSIELREV